MCMFERGHRIGFAIGVRTQEHHVARQLLVTLRDGAGRRAALIEADAVAGATGVADFIHCAAVEQRPPAHLLDDIFARLRLQQHEAGDQFLGRERAAHLAPFAVAAQQPHRLRAGAQESARLQRRRLDSSFRALIGAAQYHEFHYIVLQTRLSR